RTHGTRVHGCAGESEQGVSGRLNTWRNNHLAMGPGSEEHLLALINDVRDISKLAAGQLNVAASPVESRPLSEKAVRTVRPLADGKTLSLDLEIAPEAGTVIADSRRVEQVLLNLLSNAIKFTEQGSVRVRCTVEGPWVRIGVTDTGIGIEKEYRERLFKPFTQIETGLARKYEGTGLGLSISKRLVTLMGGEITVESEPGRGSTFSFTLPRERSGS
ncbi:HAMP domain-containing sensor histidine kinase, partial [Methanoregula sp.]|uniref:sensor histidine kinase n=1 Tax=Methanoregula sp. TaxID=2052170 RepID=UPI000CB4E39E